MRLLKHPKRLNSVGDTIIEVMIVLAILGLAFTLSSITANRGLAQARNAQEHSQGQGILNSQMELLRKHISAQGSTPAIPFCMNGTAVDTTLTNCTVNGLYTPSITYNTADGGYYEFRVKWSGQGNLGNQQELMTYRLHALTPTTNPTYILSASKPQVQVKVQRYTPVPDGNGGYKNNANPCSGSVSNKPATGVTLQPSVGAAQYGPTGGTSVAVFDDLIANLTYTASVAPPVGYNVCPPNPAGSNSVVAANGPPTLIDGIKIYPQCHPETHQKYTGYYSDYRGFYGDELGVYGDPITTYNWAHTGGENGKEGRHIGPGWPANTFQVNEGGQLVEYRIRTDLGYNSTRGWFYEHWVWTAYPGTGPPYMHYTAPYDHWWPPTHHHIPVVVGVCTDFPADF